jgi:hypothetical protein
MYHGGSSRHPEWRFGMNARRLRRGGFAAVVTTVVLVIGSLPASGRDVTFERTWGGADVQFGPVERAEGVAVAPDGSSYIVGQTPNFGTGAENGNSDLFLVKYAPDGTIAWQRTYGLGPTGFNNFGMDVEVAPDGTVWITGALQFADLLLAQFDADGNLLSERRIVGNGTPRALDIASDGSIYVTGIDFSGTGLADAFVMKTAPDGTPTWTRRWGVADRFAIGVDVAAGSDGTVSVAGDIDNAAFVVSFDADGALVWERTWQAGSVQDFSSGQGVAVGPNGGVYLTGTAQVPGVQNAMLVKFAPDGSVVWEKTWSARDVSSAFGIAVAPSGTASITGNVVRFRQADDDNAFIVAFDPDGRVRRAATWGAVNRNADPDDPSTVSDQLAQAIAVADDGSLFVAGGTTGPPPYDFRNATRRTRTPASVVGTPGGTVTMPAVEVTDPDGIITEPNGSETFAGGTDAFLLRVAP